ncbi:MAG: aldolase/citrate lyase family protein [Bacillota bacterium]|nr:aldolase/citrate lyase family protein [Bacillota bacterium]
MISNHVKAKLKQGKVSVGTWLSISSPYMVEQIAHTGLDWLVCDAEHNPMTIEDLANMFIAMAGTPTAPMVRIPWNNGEWIKRVLDAGAWGIVVPMVCCRAEAEAAVEAAKYPPVGMRSVGGGRHKISLDGSADPDYHAHANEHTMVVVQMEHVKAVENADEILSVPGVDACYIGPNDLAASLGMKPAGDSDDPRFVEAVDHILKTAQTCGVAPGMHVYTVEQMNKRIAQGFRMLALSSEMGLMLSAITSALPKINRG